MPDAAFNRAEIIALVVRLTLVSAVTFFSIKWLMNQVDPTNKSKKKAREKAEEQLKRYLNPPLTPNLTSHSSLNTDGSITVKNLSDHEMMIASRLVHPEDINVTWANIAGLESLIQELKETVIFPIQRRELFADSQLTRAPRGVLLHGPPGCGKTLIAKAMAREAGMRFVNLEVSLLTDKWYGESQKLAAAVFTLAAKLQPCIIFIDEMDSFLRARNINDHEATAMMKAQFMSLWDGLITDPDCSVIVMGATNRPQDLDTAILRRMPASFHVALPNVIQRRQILELTLTNEPVAVDVNLERLAQLSENFSGSDLREMCRNASVYRVRDHMRTHPNQTCNDEEFHDALRPITMYDLQMSLRKMRESRITYGTLPQPRIELD